MIQHYNNQYPHKIRAFSTDNHTFTKVRLTLCLILLRYPTSQSGEGKKHQPGSVSQGPPGTEACWDGGQGMLVKTLVI